MPKSKTQKRFEACSRMIKFEKSNPKDSTMAGYQNTLVKLPIDLQNKLESIRKGQ